MKRFISLLAVSCLVLFLIPKTAKAQLPPWAAGSISLKYAGNGNDCNKPTPYLYTLQIYRDYSPTNPKWPTSINIIVRSLKLNIQRPFALDTLISNKGLIEQYCLNGNPVATEGAWYSSKIPDTLERTDDWQIIGVGDIRSPEYLNVQPAQSVIIQTKLDNRPCGSVTVDGKTYTNKLPTSSPSFIRPHPVISFCSGIGKTYQYKIPATDPDGDKLQFDLTSPVDDEFGAVRYEGLFSSQIPFPSSSFIQIDRGTGVLSFTPNLRFSALVGFKIAESRPWYQIKMKCLAPNGDCPKPSDSTATIDSTGIATSIMFRDVRVIFDNNCNDRLPKFEGVEARRDKHTGQIVYDSRYNAKEDAYEFDCASTQMVFNMTNPMFCNTLDKNDFRLALTYNKTDSVVNAIDSVIASKCTNNEFDQITVYLHRPIGPGRYNMFFRYGSNDSTTMLNRCDFSLPINKPWAKIYVNTNFEYEHPITNYTYCDPADALPIAKAVKPGGRLKVPARVFYTWRMEPINPLSETDTVFAEQTSRINGSLGSKWPVYAPKAKNNPNQKVTNVEWEVGAGFDYSIYDPFTGDTIEKKICYDTDRFTVTRYENPEVEIPDYDLCPFDDWPVIDLDSMVTKHNAVIKEFVWRSYMEFPKKLLTQEQKDDTLKWSITRAGYSDFEVPGALTDRYNYFSSEVPLDINGHICRERDTFIVVKENVKVRLGGDTMLCAGETFYLTNNYQYLVPDSMTFRWFLNDTLVEGNNTDTMYVTRQGKYKLEATKHTIVNSICMGVDSMYVGIADSLYAPNIVCHDVTFKDGIVKQKFGYSVVKGADGYQVRAIDTDGKVGKWEEANGDYGIFHTIDGPQMKAQVRPYNNEVPLDAPCRFGPVSNIAEACDVVVKTVNVFTPNGDGINDFLAFDLLELYPGSKLQVFNRFGKLVFEDNDYYNDWDGGDLKSGTYFYILDINDPSYGIFKGNITLLRDK